MRYYFGKKHLCVIAVVLLLGTLTACESSQTDIPSQTEKEGSSNNPTGEHSEAEQDTALEEDKYSVVLEPTGVDRVVFSAISSWAFAHIRTSEDLMLMTRLS